VERGRWRIGKRKGWGWWGEKARCNLEHLGLLPDRIKKVVEGKKRGKPLKTNSAAFVDAGKTTWRWKGERNSLDAGGGHSRSRIIQR